MIVRAFSNCIHANPLQGLAQNLPPKGGRENHSATQTASQPPKVFGSVTSSRRCVVNNCLDDADKIAKSASSDSPKKVMHYVSYQLTSIDNASQET